MALKVPKYDNAFIPNIITKVFIYLRYFKNITTTTTTTPKPISAPGEHPWSENPRWQSCDGKAPWTDWPDLKCEKRRSCDSRVLSIRVGEIFLCLILIISPTRFARRGITYYEHVSYLLRIHTIHCRIYLQYGYY